MINKVILFGRLAGDPELRFTPSGAGVTSFTIAVDGDYNKDTKKRDTEFVKCVAWNRKEFKLAEYIANDLQKGNVLYVEGKLKTRNYEAKDGTGKRYITEVIASEVKYEKKKAEQNTEKTPTEQIDFSDFGVEVDNTTNLPF